MLLVANRKKQKSAPLTYRGMPADERMVRKSNKSIRNHIQAPCQNEGCEFLDDAIRFFDQPASARAFHFTQFENTD